MSIAFIGSIVTLIGGIAFFVYYVFIRPKVKPEGLKHYEKKRDDLTERKEEEEEETNDSGFPLGNLIGGFIVIIVGLTLMPTVVEQVEMTKANVTMSGPASQILDLTTTFFAIGIFLVAISMAFGALRESGLI